MEKFRSVIQNLKENHRKYRWFVTSFGNLVIGGKNSAQNDSLMRDVKDTGISFTIMHTSEPGSPFTVILAEMQDIRKQDLKECAIFTACFSKAWKLKKKKTFIDVFSSLQLFKTKDMKKGAWSIIGQVKHVEVQLRLILIKQNGFLRAIPENPFIDKSSKYLTIEPGKLKKEQLIPIIRETFNNISTEEILSALPSEGFKVIKK